jgi:hypothetical protein
MGKQTLLLGIFILGSFLSSSQAVDFKGITPKDYILEKSVKIKENPEQYALVFLEDEESSNFSGEGFRLFFLAESAYNKKTNLSYFKVLLRSSDLILCYYCGGIFGDPFENLEFVDNVLYIYHYGGSALRWSKVITIKEIKNKYFITNYTRSTSNIHTHEESSTHDDLFKKMRTITTIIEKGKPNITRLRVPDAKPILLEQFKY